VSKLVPAGPPEGKKYDLPDLSKQVDVWTLLIANATAPSLLAYCERLLSQQELERGKAFRQQEDRHSFVLAHGYLRTVLSHYACLPPAELTFEVSATGKPKLATKGWCGLIEFNLSHTRYAVAIGVSTAGSLGIDIEKTNDEIEIGGLADQFFSKLEAADIEAKPTDKRVETFIRYWTLKEAYVKARGEGLSLPLDRFGFRFGPGNCLEFAAHPGLESTQSNWAYGHMQLYAHFLSVCVGPNTGHTVARVARCAGSRAGFVQLQAEQLLPLVRPKRIPWNVAASRAR
jgi:4'-phosphopantetheinyl transferase